jgi:predicted DNA-binding helix-hairpin-helix protein
LNILNLTENLYNKFDLKRVYYSAYIPVNSGKHLPTLKNPPTLREHRLYQGDWLLRVYGFKAAELLNEKNPNFDINFDPKTTYALNNIDLFPVEINKASYNTLIRIPGIGIRGAQKIVSARRLSSLDFFDLKKLGIVIKRAQYFITCKGKYYGSVSFDGVKIKKALTPKFDLNLIDEDSEQLSFFNNDISNLLAPKDTSTSKLLLLNDKSTSVTGEL